MAKVEYVKSKVRASELVEGDFLSIGGQKFEVTEALTNDYGRIVVYFAPIDGDGYSSTLIVAEHFLFTIFNKIPKKK